MTRYSPIQMIGFWAAVALAAALPLLIEPASVQVGALIVLAIALAFSWNLVGGFGGLHSFGHSVFFGIGTYVCAVGANRFSLGFWTTLVLAVLVSVVGALFFYPILKLKSFYFALATLGVLVATGAIFKQWRFTRGSGSDVGWLVQFEGGYEFYYWVFLVTLVAMIVTTRLLLRSRFGFALHLVRTDEQMAACMGVSPARQRTGVFAISAGWIGLLGAIYAPFITVVNTESVFSLDWTINMILMSVFGGLGTLSGPVVGGLMVSLLEENLWARFPQYHSLLYGALIVVIVLIIPRGLVPTSVENAKTLLSKARRARGRTKDDSNG